MTAYTCVHARTETLVASTVDSVTFTQGQSYPTIINHSSTDTIWVTFSGTDPTVAGDECFPILPLSAWTAPVTATAIELISSGTPLYTVHNVS